MLKRPNGIALKGSPLTLIGPELKPGDKAPDFVCASGLKETVGLAQTAGKPRLFSVVPSLDTPVCSIQTKKFADELAALGDRVACYTFSMDLPFAQKRFCTDKAITNVQTLSDAHNSSFGQNYGTLIEGLAMPILSRAVFVVDKAGTITYVQYVPEVASEPNYEPAIKALKAAL